MVPTIAVSRAICPAGSSSTLLERARRIRRAITRQLSSGLKPMPLARLPLPARSRSRVGTTKRNIALRMVPSILDRTQGTCGFPSAKLGINSFLLPHQISLRRICPACPDLAGERAAQFLCRGCFSEASPRALLFSFGPKKCLPGSVQLPAGAWSHLIALCHGAAPPLLIGVCNHTIRWCRATAQRPGPLPWSSGTPTGGISPGVSQ